MPDLNLDEIEKNEAAYACECEHWGASCTRCKYIPALVAEVKRLREENIRIKKALPIDFVKEVPSESITAPELQTCIKCGAISDPYSICEFCDMDGGEY